MSINLKRTARWIGVVAVVAGAVAPGSAGAAEQETTRKVEKKVMPPYPSLARQWHLAGTVKIVVVINPNGRVKSVRTIGGHPILIEAAEEAAKQWRFEATPMETTETVAFDFVEPNK